MVSSAVFGAAAGTGLALVVAMTIVVYRYYAVKRKGKYWSNLDRWPDPPTTRNMLEGRRDRGDDHSSPSSHVLDCWRKPQKNYYAVQTGAGAQLAKNPVTGDRRAQAENLRESKENQPGGSPERTPEHRVPSQGVVLDALVKVPDKLSEVLGDVLDLACGGGGGGAGGGSGGGSRSSRNAPSGGNTASKSGVAKGVATIKYKWAQRGRRSPVSSVANTDSADSTTSTSSEEFNIAKEQHAVQPSAVESGGGLPHQSLSYPSGSGGGVGRFFTRNSSVSSQSSLEGASGTSSHRGSSPQIRAFGPDGRYHHHRDPQHAASSYPPSRSSRSPSPGRAASLDARCGSPASYSGSLLSCNASPSQSSLSSLATGVSSSCGCTSVTGNQGTSRLAGPSLSPLLIPPSRSSISDGGPAPPASPLGSLQPDLYQRKNGPIFLSARRNGKNLGRLHLRLKYDFDRSDLLVHLIEAHDLPGVDQGGFNDPYVKLTLSPEVDTRKRQTQFHRNKANPFFDQQFKFPVSYDELQDKTLVLQVLDYDRFSRSDVVGSVRVAMESLELASSASSIEVWAEVECERKPPEEIQKVLLSLSYLPSAERLTVFILKAMNLFPPQEKETLDSFVKVCLLCGEKRIKKKKTAVMKATTSPVWNEAMFFNVPAESLASFAIEVCVMDSSNDLIGSNVTIGSCVVGPASSTAPGAENSCSQGREHWLRMTQSPRKTIAMWHTLH